MFLTPANNPAPSPIVPKEPSVEVKLVAPSTNLLIKFAPAFNPSEFMMLLTNSVQLFDNLLRVPVKFSADLFDSSNADQVPSE